MIAGKIEEIWKMRVGFICEPGFEQRHVGVRSFFVTLAKAFEAAGASVKFLVLDQTHGVSQWYEAVISPMLHENNFATTDQFIEGTPLEVYLKHSNKIFECETDDYVELYPISYLAVGNILPDDYLDMAIITAPWMPGLVERLPARKVVGLVYDTIPNTYAINGKISGLFPFEHLRGFEYYTKKCDEVWTCSEYTTRCFTQFCAISGWTPPVVRTLPAVVPFQLATNFGTTVLPKEDMIVCVGLFDLRKGLLDAPDILNGVTSDYHLVICGGVRCEEHLVLDFFKKLKVKRVTWYRSIRAHTLTALYGKAKALLFNSDVEGLGLPVIEAQSMGCRALTSDAQAIQEILVEGSVALPRLKAEPFSNTLNEMLHAEFDAVALANQARQRFDFGLQVAFAQEMMA